MNGARAANEGTIARRLCHKKWLMLHFLSLQRNNRLNASAMDSANGKNGEKDCILHHTVEMKQSHPMIRGSFLYELYKKSREHFSAFSLLITN